MANGYGQTTFIKWYFNIIGSSYSLYSFLSILSLNPVHRIIGMPGRMAKISSMSQFKIFFGMKFSYSILNHTKIYEQLMNNL